MAGDNRRGKAAHLARRDLVGRSCRPDCRVRDPRVDYDDGTTIGEAQERFITFEYLL
ncbi:MAG: hypothetical protein V3T08_00405 [Gemmatimonadota bacterium]